jgi:hypothetical protein
MRNVFAGVLGLGLAGGLVAHGIALAGGSPLLAPRVLSAVDGGIAPAISLAGKGVVQPPAIEDIEEMCALLIGCPDVPLSVPSQDLGECVKMLWSQLAHPDAVKFSIPLRECGLRADSCKELRECGLRGASPDSCQGRGMDRTMSFCDGDGRALTCSKGKLVQVRDCPRFGEQCAAKGGTSTCYLGTCPPEVPNDGTPVCSGNGHKIFVCDAGKLLSFDCGAFGLACVKGPDDKPTCAPPTASCGKDHKKCDGDDFVGCVGGHEVKVECGKLGMKCAEKPGKDTIGGCVPPPGGGADGGAPCAANFQSKCVGNNVQYCVGGRTRSFFCKGLGFAKCVGGPGQAHCAN